jgi:hypothetical protein
LGFKSTFVDAEEFFGHDGDELEDIGEEGDPDAKNDPLYHLNLKVCSLMITS